MKVEGHCPNCGERLGIEVKDTVVDLMGDTVERMVNKDGNAIRCTNCTEYVEPEGTEVETEY